MVKNSKVEILLSQKKVEVPLETSTSAVELQLIFENFKLLVQFKIENSHWSLLPAGPPEAFTGAENTQRCVSEAGFKNSQFKISLIILLYAGQEVCQALILLAGVGGARVGIEVSGN